MLPFSISSVQYRVFQYPFETYAPVANTSHLMTESKAQEFSCNKINTPFSGRICIIKQMEVEPDEPATAASEPASDTEPGSQP